MKKLKCIVLSVAMTLPMINSAHSFRTGSEDFFFRYPGGTDLVEVVAKQNEADITASFTSFIGEGFSENIPTISDEDIFTWAVTSGTLPEGLYLNGVTGVIAGTPSGSTETTEVFAEAFNSEGDSIVTANITIDVLDPSIFTAAPFEFYGRVGTYNVERIPVADGLNVETWSHDYPAPPGVTIDKRIFQGAPSEAGNYPIVSTGYDFLNNEVAKVRGTYIVEEVPSFTDVPDKLYSFSAKRGFATFSVSPAAYRTIDPSGDVSKMRYFVEVAEGDLLPPGLSVSTDGEISGDVSLPYHTATVRFRALDVDGRIGYSNWFEIGTLETTPSFTQQDIGPFFPIVDEEFTLAFASEGTSGTRNYTVVSGTLPDGISLNPTTGEISGVATTLERQENIVIRLEITNNGSVDTIETDAFVMETKLAAVGLEVSNQSHDPANVRVNDIFSATISTTGPTLEPFTVVSNDALPNGMAFNDTTGVLFGSIGTAGKYTTNFTLTNGDEQTAQTGLTINVFNPLTIGTAQDITIAQYDSAEILSTITHDPDGVMPAVEGAGAPIFTVSPELPEGMVIDASDGTISGGTSNTLGSYGPYNINLQDGSGTVVSSNSFTINVTPRTGIALTAQDLTFTYKVEETKNPVAALTTPALATDLAVTYTIEEGTLPVGYTLDSNTGEISGVSSVLTTETGIKIKATDEEGYEAISQAFSIEVVMPGPITQKTTEPTLTTVGYPTVIPALEFINVIGDLTYSEADPLPNGLSLDADTGLIIGQTNEVVDNGSFRINVIDDEGRTAKGSLILSVIPNPSVDLGLESSPINASRLGDMSVQLVGYDTIGPQTFSLESGSLPFGTALSTSGLLSGIPNDEGTYSNIVVRVTDGQTGLTGDSAPFSIVVGPRQDMELSYADEVELFRDLTNGLPIKPSVNSNDGSVSYNLDSGPLPAGLSLDTETGFITGTPTEFGVYPITISGVDEDGSADAYSFSIDVSLFGTTEQPENATYTFRINETIDTGAVGANNFVAPITFSHNGTLPAGIIVSEVDGSIYGAPSESGEFGFTISSVDALSRGSNPSTSVEFIVLDDVSVEEQPVSITTNQYSAATPAVGAIFENAIGTLTYSLQGTLLNGQSFNTTTGLITGIPNVIGVASNLTITAVDDYDGSSATTDAFSITVDAPLDMIVELPSSAATIVNQGVANIATVSVQNAGLGQPVTYSVSGTLPAGVTMDTSTGVFSGTATAVGSYPNIYVTVTDALNRIEVAGPLTIEAILDGEPIALSVSDVETKANFAFYSEEPVSSNTVGDISYYSYDVVPGISFDSNTGVVSGNLATTQLKQFDVYIADETTRITSERLQISVLPNLDLSYPSTIIMNEQDNSITTEVDTLYEIGTVTYEAEEPSDLPAGVSVNPTTGTIEGRPTEFGVFPNIQVRGTDVFEFGTDSQLSNAFTINVNELIADPVIDDIPGNDLGMETVGVAISSFTPVVTDNIHGQPWSKEPLTFSINKDLSGDTGLSFNTATGEISGTPTAPILYTDMTITALAQSGVSVTTAPFQFAVQPANSIVAAAGQTSSFTYRKDEAISLPAPVFENTYGNLTFELDTGSASYISAYPVDVNTGAITSDANNFSPPNTNITLGVRVTDELGRQAVFDYTVYYYAAISVSSNGNIAPAGIEMSSSVPVVNGVYGSTTFSFSSLVAPDGSTWTGNADGSITGNFISAAEGDTFDITVTATDSFDGWTGSTVVTFEAAAPISLTGSRYWEFQCWSPQLNASSGLVIGDIKLFDKDGIDVTGLISSTTANGGMATANLFDGSGSSYFRGRSGSQATALVFDFGTNPQEIDSVEFTPGPSSLAGAHCDIWLIASSSDGVFYQVEWADAANLGDSVYTSVNDGSELPWNFTNHVAPENIHGYFWSRNP